ncbi:hypothetical protein LC612_05105 [Nostoc sp. CHAB 5834]|nr:hypothetical protein [Nostoc sp. CHAB 5834]
MGIEKLPLPNLFFDCWRSPAERLHHRPNSYAYYFSVANSCDRAPKLHNNDGDRLPTPVLISGKLA